MSNQTFLWSALVLPWLTLLLMRKENIKRFMPVALFTVVASLVIGDIGATLKLWAGKENIFPLGHTNPLV